MDKITLSNMKFFGFHGCAEFEKRNGQIFEADAEIEMDLKTAGQTDGLNDSINYADIFEKIKHVMENERYNLLERVAQRVADQVLQDPRVNSVTVRIRKPGVPLPGMLDCVQVEIQRDQNS